MPNYSFDNSSNLDLKLVDIWDEYTGKDSIDDLNFSFNTANNLAKNNLAISAGTTVGTDGNDILTGDSANNRLSGGNGDDELSGLGGDDTLVGGSGDDELDGGTGNDTMIGGLGDDSYIVDSTGDSITEGLNKGADFVLSSVSYTLSANLEALVLLGTAAINGTGNSLNNVVAGNRSNNTLNGGAGNDVLIGSIESLVGLGNQDGNDKLIGGSGDDVLLGNLGNDRLTGGTGKDRFIFNALNEGVDNITDYKVVDDTIEVSRSGFGGGLVADAAISAAQFRIGSSANTASQRFIYDSVGGALFFDIDGNGSTAAIKIATLSTGLAMTNNDIFVVD